MSETNMADQDQLVRVRAFALPDPVTADQIIEESKGRNSRCCACGRGDGPFSVFIVVGDDKAICGYPCTECADTGVENAVKKAVSRLTNKLKSETH